MATGPISFVGGVGGIGPQRIGSGKSIPFLSKLVSASQTNAYSRYIKDYSGTYDFYVMENSHLVGGGDVSNISIGLDTVFMDGSSGNTLPDVGQSISVEKAVAEYNGVVVPITVNGSRSFVVQDGVINNLSDEFKASQFSSSAFAYNSEIKVRFLIGTGFTTSKLGISQIDPRATGGTSIWYSSADCTVSDIDIVGGTPVVTGATQTARNEIINTRLIGRFTNPSSISMIARGDSITQGVGDTSTNPQGPGWFFRMRDEFTVKPAMMNLASSGSQSVSGLTDIRLIELYKLCNVGVVAFGANDLGSAGTGSRVTLSANCELIRSQMASAGVSSTAIMELLPRTTSTDLFATEINQTYSGDWIPGGNPDLYNQSLPASFDFLVPMDSMRGIDVWKTTSTGVARAFTFDGTHPSEGGSLAMAEESAVIFANNISGLIAI